jgi:hypothetical protein
MSDNLSGESNAKVTTSLQYWDGKSKPLSYMSQDLVPPGGQTTFDMSSLTFQMNDMRKLAAETTLSLDSNGFEFVHHRTSLSPESFLDAKVVKDMYYKEMERLLLDNITGSKRVIIFDHNVRSAGLDLFGNKNSEDRYGKVQTKKVSVSGPVLFAHNDYTHRSGPMRLSALTKGAGSGGSYVAEKPLLTIEEADSLLQKRFAIVQVWRPINKPVQDVPLAILDARSVKPEEFVESRLVYPDREGFTYLIAPNPAHQWYFAPRMDRDEAMLFKCYDTQLDGRARFTAHSAFELPDVPEDAPKRESIEIRAFVFFDEKRSADASRL